MTELIIGVGLPSFPASGEDPIELAAEAERLGYDFVSAADHPAAGDPSYETATMLTWIAARTSRIKVASRVLAVPLRRPAMVAKLATSLDVLSDGRFILGLGAGYSDEEITAVGGPTLSPGAKIDGLEEALQVIRGAWTQSGFSKDGHHYTVRNLTMEPRPPHAVPIWLGSFGPRALAVTGRLADGWIPSLGYMPVEQIPAMRSRIDAAAQSAGRRPEQIRSILNLSLRIDNDAHPQPDAIAGSATQVVSQLQKLRDMGFTGFNFMLSGPDRKTALLQAADEVLPELRRTG